MLASFPQIGLITPYSDAGRVTALFMRPYMSKHDRAPTDACDQLGTANRVRNWWWSDHTVKAVDRTFHRSQ